MGIDLGVMILAHRRPWLLPMIIRQVSCLAPSVRVQFVLDRPWAGVAAQVNELIKLHNVDEFEAPHPALDSRERYMGLRKFQREKIEPFAPKFLFIWDDDHILSYPSASIGLLAKDDFDMADATKLFLWDRVDRVNTAIPTHRSVLFFRHVQGDRFDVARMLHAPAQRHDNPSNRVREVPGYLLDVGYLLQSERLRVWNEYKRVGKIDASTKPLVMPPELRPIREFLDARNCSWHQELRELFE